MRRVLPLLLVSGALAACGGGADESDIEDAIRGWAKAANERDTKAFCNDFVTDEFAERVSGATGDNARKQCEKLLEATQPGLTIEIREVSKIKIDGDSATAVVNMVAGSAPSDRLFKLKKEDGEFRIASSGEP
jgi:ketosteroid isomerase-like protein